MRKRNFLTALAVAAVVFPLGSCGLFDNSSDPADPEKTQAPETPSEAPEPPSETPETPHGPLAEVGVDAGALRGLEAPKGAEAEQFQRAKDNVEVHTLKMFDPVFLSGEWNNQVPDEYWGVFRDTVGDELYADMVELDPASDDSINTILSLAAVFTPTETVTAPASCTLDATSLRGCLISDVTLSDATAAVEGSTGLYVFTYKVSTTRGVDIQGEAGQMTLNYDVKLWVDPESGRVLSVNNTYNFSEASKVN